jgi:hypothetical protein
LKKKFGKTAFVIVNYDMELREAAFSSHPDRSHSHPCKSGFSLEELFYFILFGKNKQLKIAPETARLGLAYAYVGFGAAAFIFQEKLGDISCFWSRWVVMTDRI